MLLLCQPFSTRFLLGYVSLPGYGEVRAQEKKKTRHSRLIFFMELVCNRLPNIL